MKKKLRAASLKQNLLVLIKKECNSSSLTVKLFIVPFLITYDCFKLSRKQFVCCLWFYPFAKCCKWTSIVCLRIVTGMVPDEEDSFGFRFKTSFLVSFLRNWFKMETVGYYFKIRFFNFLCSNVIVITFHLRLNIIKIHCCLNYGS